ncbi:lipopolysaccharide assembly protein LapA domain-containing protein [Arenicellales bacterium IMCC58067]
MRFIKKAVFSVALFLIVVFGITFAAKNPQEVTLVYFDFLWKGKIVFALLVALLLGFFLGAVPAVVAFFLGHRANRSRSKSPDIR